VSGHPSKEVSLVAQRVTLAIVPAKKNGKL